VPDRNVKKKGLKTDTTKYKSRNLWESFECNYN